MTLGLEEFQAIASFLEARSPTSSARDIAAWCEARDVATGDVLLFAQALTRSSLATIAAAEEEDGEPMAPGGVAAVITAAVVTGLQVGLDAERRRRDANELPLNAPRRSL
jgi:hypothetical protein